jgi:hypothetical protein
MNEKNLRRLAKYLQSRSLKADFIMSYYSRKQPLGYGIGNCGTAGCAVGHGPYAGIRKLKKEDWLSYSVRVFGLERHSREWDWCFSGLWASKDNTPKGAAKRILTLLKSGVPGGWQC